MCIGVLGIGQLAPVNHAQPQGGGTLTGQQPYPKPHDASLYTVGPCYRCGSRLQRWYHSRPLLVLKLAEESLSLLASHVVHLCALRPYLMENLRLHIQSIKDFLCCSLLVFSVRMLLTSIHSQTSRLRFLSFPNAHCIPKCLSQN